MSKQYSKYDPLTGFIRDASNMQVGAAIPGMQPVTMDEHSTVDDIIKLKNAGFTADDIIAIKKANIG